MQVFDCTGAGGGGSAAVTPSLFKGELYIVFLDIMLLLHT